MKRIINKIRHWPLQALIIVPFVMLVVLAGSLAGYLSYRNGQAAVEQLTLHLMREVNIRIHSKIDEFLKIPPFITRFNSSMFSRGLMDTGDNANIERLFLEQLQQFNVQGIFVGTADGRGTAVFLQSDQTFQSRIIEHPPKRLFYALDKEGRRSAVLQEKTWDPRVRPWYRIALEKNEVVWSPVYTFTDGVLGLTSSQAVYDPSDKLLGVVGVDLDLSFISDFLQNLTISPSGQSFIIDPAGFLLATSTKEPLSVIDATTKQLRRIQARDSRNPIIQNIIQAVQKRFGSTATLTNQLRFVVVQEGESMYVQWAPVKDKQGLDWIVVVAVPEEDFKASITADTNNSLKMTVLGLMLTMLLGFFTSQRITKPIQELYSASLKITEGDLNQRVNVRWTRELTILSEAFNRMSDSFQHSFAAMRAMKNELEVRVKERTRDLLQAKEIAEKATKAKSDFLATMSHEIRTPINAILGLTGLAMDSELTPKVRDYLTKTEKASHLLLRIINDILDFSKVEAGRVVLEAAAFDLEALFDNLAGLFRKSASDKSIELIFSLPSDAPHSLIGDSTRLEQVLMNLIGNALKFTEQGEVQVQATVQGQSQDRVFLTFSIRDTGIGLHTEQIPNLFESFVQADGSVTRKYGGTGLGLSICKHLVELMGGEIGVKSIPGEGSEFFFTAEFGRQPEAKQNKTMEVKTLGTLHVLVVDDNQAAAAVTQESLRFFQFESQLAYSGQQALAVLEAGFKSAVPFDLIIMDQQMPGMDGIATTQKIVALYNARNAAALLPKMILLTAEKSDTNLKEQAGMVGVACLIHKPVLRVELFNGIMEVFGHRDTTILSRGQGSRIESDTLAKIGNARVLLVEDNALNRDVARGILENVGLVVEEAHNGLVAIQMAGRNRYDVILMDVQMPGLDGYETTRRIRQDRRCQRLPIIAMTAHALESDRSKSLAAGMNEHISKPIIKTVLYAALVRWINPEGSDARFGQLRQQLQRMRPDAEGLPPLLDGIDMEEALDRFDNDQTRLKSHLLRFDLDFANTVHEIERALEKKDLKVAGRLLHTMKGIAGNFAAKDLERASIDLEKSIDQNREEEILPKLEDFEYTLNRVLAAIRTLGRATEEHSPVDNTAHTSENEVDLNQVKPLLTTLSQFLQDHDLESKACLHSLQHILRNTSFHGVLSQLEGEVMRLEFQNAQVTLQQIGQRLQDLPVKP